MLPNLRAAVGRGRLPALAILFFAFLAGSAHAGAQPVNAPTETAVRTNPQGSARMGGNVVPLAEVTSSGTDFAIGGSVSFFVCSTTNGCPTGGTPLGTRDTPRGQSAGTTGQIAGPAFTPPKPGRYCFRGEYSGSGGIYLPSTSKGTLGCVDVLTAVTKTMTFSAPPTIGQPFSAVFDLQDEQGQPVVGSLTVGDGSSGCGGGGPWSETIPLVNGRATTTTYTPTSTDPIPYSVSLSAPGYELVSSCGWIIASAAPTTSNLTLSAKTLAAGASVTATHKVTASGAAGTPAGVSVFSVCGPLATPTGCSSGGTQVGPSSSLVGGTATSVAFKPVLAGFYCFRADYFGGDDPRYASSSASGPGQCVELANGGTGISLFLSPDVGVGERAVIRGRVTRPGGTPTGNVRTYMCGPMAAASGCPGGGDFAGNPNLQNGQFESAWFIPELGKYYCLRAEYAGDAQTPGITEGGSSGCFVWNTWRSQTARSAPGAVELKGGKGATGATFGISTSTIKPAGVKGSVAAWVCGPLPTAAGCGSGGISLPTSALSADGTSVTGPVTAAGPGFYCVRARFTSTDATVRNSSSGADDDGQGASCFEVKLPRKELTALPVTKVQGDPDPVPQLADPSDPSITGAMACTYYRHSEVVGTYQFAAECGLGSLKSTDWTLVLHSTVSLTITAKPTSPNPSPTPAPGSITPTPVATPNASASVLPPGAAGTPQSASASVPPPGGGSTPQSGSAPGPSNLVTITKLASVKGAVTLTLRTPGPGGVLVTVQAGKKRVTRAVKATKAGLLTAKFTVKQLRSLTAKTKKGKKVKLTLQARFTPTGGTPGTVGPRTVSVTVG